MAITPREGAGSISRFHAKRGESMSLFATESTEAETGSGCAFSVNSVNSVASVARFGAKEATPMHGGTRLRSWGLTLATALLASSAASADEHLWCRWSCPRSSYSACNYLTPNVFPLLLASERRSLYHAPNTHPELPLHYQDVRFRCPQVPPEQYPFPPFELNPRAMESPPPSKHEDAK